MTSKSLENTWKSQQTWIKETVISKTIRKPLINIQTMHLLITILPRFLTILILMGINNIGRRWISIKKINRKRTNKLKHHRKNTRVKRNQKKIREKSILMVNNRANFIRCKQVSKMGFKKDLSKLWINHKVLSKTNSIQL